MSTAKKREKRQAGEWLKPERDVAKILGHAAQLGLERRTYTIEEAAKILGVCRAVAYREGVLPTIRIGNRRLVPKQAIARMLLETA